MKKLLCAILVLCMFTSPVFPVWAAKEDTDTNPDSSAENTEKDPEEDTEKTEEYHITEVIVSGVTTPVAGEAIFAKPLDKAKVEVANEENEALLFSESAYWSISGSSQKLEGGSFAAGKTYRLTVTVHFELEGTLTLNVSKAKYEINGKTATLDKKSSSDSSLVFYAEFDSELGEGGITPKVTLDPDSDKTKTYDGKALEIKAKVTNAIDGVGYSFQWYRDEKILKDETSESIALVNVADSGEYTCKVTATLSSKKESTTSDSVKITVSPFVVNVEIQDAEKYVSEKDPAFEYKIQGEEPADQLLGDLEREEGEEVGEYVIGKGTLCFPDEIAANYELKITEGTLKIRKEGDPVLLKADNQSGVEGIRVYAILSKLPEGSSFVLTDADGATVATVESKLAPKKVMKAFTVGLLNDTEKNITLPKNTTVRLEIPLAENEQNFKKGTISVVLKNGQSEKILPAKTVSGGVGNALYLSVEIDTLGTILVIEGDKPTASAGTTTQNPSKDKDDEEKSGAAWLWILITILILGAIGAIVFTVLQSKKMSVATKRYVPVKKPVSLTPEQQRERERARRIADEINAMPPVPEAASSQPKIYEPDPSLENGMRTRAVPSVEPKPAPPQDEPRTRKIISFDDLEG